MAFNFNWSPLAADAEFYKRAQELLTDALNKNPKPPIIVDDILVTELNLGSVPPELEILEIGDLAEDRFRGIFKMCYSGDAFLTLRTRVQANPLNTYLSAKPSFTSPKPLAASAGLTIPLSITLSEIKLSAFIILVFSKQKGLTLVFRNDPLESLKVSSTFDSIQFVRDYLQRTIEGQLRNLMMDELPAIIHKLSLRLWCPDQLPREEVVEQNTGNDTLIDPFANPPVEAVDSHGHVLDANDISSLSLDGGTGAQSLFSQKNMLRLAALTDSHRTLSLFTPGIRNAIFRAWAGPTERHETGTTTPISAPALCRMPSAQGSSTIYTFNDTSSVVDQGSLPSRPSLTSFNSVNNGLPLGAGKHSRNLRKKKTRVVNLRRSKTGSESSSDTTDTVSDTFSVNAPISEPIVPMSIPEEIEAEEEEEEEPPRASHRNRYNNNKSTPIRPPLNMEMFEEPTTAERTPLSLVTDDEKAVPPHVQRAREIVSAYRGPDFQIPNTAGSENPSVILEQAWIMKMADEIARRVYHENKRNEKLWEERHDTPPPAYHPTQ